MNQEERERTVDRLLNEALSRQDVEPRAGLEQRILANLRAQPGARRWWRWMPLWGAAAIAAVVLLAIALQPTRPAQTGQAPVVVEQKPGPATHENQAPTERRVVASRRRPRRGTTAVETAIAKPTAPEPRQPVFAPAQLTEAERALVAMLRSNPDEAKVVAERQAQTRQESVEYIEQSFKVQ